jgi:DNA-binding PadR family transcriptional regulator
MASMYQITDEGLEEIRRESMSKNWLREIERIQGQFETYRIPNFKTVQGEAGFIELLAKAKLNSESRR